MEGTFKLKKSHLRELESKNSNLRGFSKAKDSRKIGTGFSMNK